MLPAAAREILIRALDDPSGPYSLAALDRRVADFLDAAEELRLLPRARVVVCLGQYAWDAAARIFAVRPRPRFGHGSEHETAAGPTLLGSFHPSQQNTFTGRLTEEMMDAVFRRASELTDR